MSFVPDPAGKNQLAWAQAVYRYLRDLDRRINSILPQRPQAVEESTRAKTTLQPFQLIVSSSGGETPTPMIRVVASTLAGGSSEELGFAEGDAPPYLLTPSEGKLVGGITYDILTRTVTSRWLEILATIPDPEDGTAYVEIGTVAADGAAWIVANSRYGPLTADVCRNWFAAAAPFYNVTWT